MKTKIKILNVVGARPNFIKIAPLVREMRRYPGKIAPLLVHTGQHFDNGMSGLFFKDLKLPRPDFYLGVGSDSHAGQTAKIMQRFERILLKVKPDLVLVVGDVNSTFACALCAAKLHIPVAHVEAGLRSFDNSMPEEINRRLTDNISSFLFITEESARENLLREGLKRKNIYFVGNVMIDTLLSYRKKADDSDILRRLKLEKGKYATLTLHRPSNVDTKTSFMKILGALDEIQKRITIVWPIHPRTKKMIKGLNLKNRISRMRNLIILPAIGYLDSLKLMAGSRFVLTDSGGIQEETTILKVPCLTLRENTERPVTIDKGTNKIAGLDRDRIMRESFNILSGNFKTNGSPKFWDGKSAKRIVKILIRELRGKNGSN